MTLVPTALQQRWAAYSAQEKLVWSGLGMALLAVVLWLYVWQPLADRHAQARQSLAQAEETVQYLQRAAPRLRLLSAVSAPNGTAVQSMTNLVSRTASNHDIDLTRFEQSGTSGLRVWIDNQPFDQLLTWLAELDSQGVEVDQLTLSQGNGPGLVTVRGVVVRR